MTVVAEDPVWTIDVPGSGHTYKVAGGRIVLDERYSIYCLATIRLAPMTPAAYAALNPLDGDLRATITVAQEIIAPTPDSQSRDFDLLVFERTKSPLGLVTLQLGSDDVMLEIRALVDNDLLDVYDQLPGNPNNSAREAISYVLDEFFSTTLEAGAVDADITRTVEIVNLIQNGSFEADVSAWSVNANVSSIVRSTTQAASGSASLRFTAAAGDASIKCDQHPRVEPGAWYWFSFAVRSSVSRTCEAIVRWLDSDGLLIGAQVSGLSLATSTSAWSTNTGLINPVRAPLDAATAEIRIVARANASGNLHYIDQVIFAKVPDGAFDFTGYVFNPGGGGSFSSFLEYQGGTNLGRITAFDGAGDADSAVAPYYDYSWDGTAYLSTSRRTPKDNYGFDMTLMKPGQTFRAFLQPIIDATGGRLFCDEARDWRLVDDSYTPGGTITVEDGLNLHEATEIASLTRSVDGLPQTFSGVVLAYRSTDRTTGRTRIDYDVAGNDSARVYTRTIDGTFPGHGVASSFLARASGRGRELAPTALVDYDASPGQSLIVTHDGEDFTGFIRRVEFELEDGSHLMTITARDLEAA